jgi:hypothetical protein
MNTVRVVARCTITKVTDLYQERIENLVLRYEKCLNFSGDYVEKHWSDSTIKCEMLFLQLKTTQNLRIVIMAFAAKIGSVHNQWNCDNSISFMRYYV